MESVAAGGAPVVGAVDARGVDESGVDAEGAVVVDGGGAVRVVSGSAGSVVSGGSGSDGAGVDGAADVCERVAVGAGVGAACWVARTPNQIAAVARTADAASARPLARRPPGGLGSRESVKSIVSVAPVAVDRASPASTDANDERDRSADVNDAPPTGSPGDGGTADDEGGIVTLAVSLAADAVSVGVLSVVALTGVVGIVGVAGLGAGGADALAVLVTVLGTIGIVAGALCSAALASGARVARGCA